MYKLYVHNLNFYNLIKHSNHAWVLSWIPSGKFDGISIVTGIGKGTILVDSFDSPDESRLCE